MHLSAQDQKFIVPNYQYAEKWKINNSDALCVHTDLNSHISIEEHVQDALKVEPTPAADHPDNFQVSQDLPFVLDETLISISQFGSEKQEQQEDPLALQSSKDVSDHEIHHLLSQAAKELGTLLKPNWVYVTEGDGIHVMLLSRSFEKCVQRRLFFRRNGDVHLSVHCVPIPITFFFPYLQMVPLRSPHNITEFVHAMESIVNVVRQLEICTGVCQEKYKHLWGISKKGDVDKNPYKEARYSVTFRSFECIRLVRPRQRMCHSCDRLQDSLRMKERSIAKKNNKLSNSNYSTIKRDKKGVDSQALWPGDMMMSDMD